MKLYCIKLSLENEEAEWNGANLLAAGKGSKREVIKGDCGGVSN